jgi:uracil DNA glycosylase
MAWGKHAQNMIAGIDKVSYVPPPLLPSTRLVPWLRSGLTCGSADQQRTNLVLTSAHPSPFAANKGFFGNGHFKKANDWLVGKYGVEGGIDWRSLGAAE